jgi:hypothetical protein
MEDYKFRAPYPVINVGNYKLKPEDVKASVVAQIKQETSSKRPGKQHVTNKKWNKEYVTERRFQPNEKIVWEK